MRCIFVRFKVFSSEFFFTATREIAFHGLSGENNNFHSLKHRCLQNFNAYVFHNLR